MAEKRGKKLRRGPKHANMYAAQVFRTARNKAAARTRIARRKKDNPCPPGKRHAKRRQRRNRSVVLTQEQAYQRLIEPKADQ